MLGIFEKLRESVPQTFGAIRIRARLNSLADNGSTRCGQYFHADSSVETTKITN